MKTFVPSAIRRLLAAAVLGLGSVAASASPLAAGQSVQVGNVAGSVFTPSPSSGDPNGLYSNLTINVSGSNVGVAAGLFVLDYNNGSGWEQFLAFCLSPDVWLYPFDNPYSVNALSSMSYASSANDIAEFWGRFRSSVTNDVTAAAFQVGLWELAYDGGRALNTGSFRLMTSGSVYNLAQNWLNALDGTGPMASGLLVLVDNPKNTVHRQNLITQVPEPGSLALLGVALGAFGIATRRKARQ